MSRLIKISSRYWEWTEDLIGSWISGRARRQAYRGPSRRARVLDETSALEKGPVYLPIISFAVVAVFTLFAICAYSCFASCIANYTCSQTVQIDRCVNEKCVPGIRTAFSHCIWVWWYTMRKNWSERTSTLGLKSGSPEYGFTIPFFLSFFRSFFFRGQNSAMTLFFRLQYKLCTFRST